MVNKYKIHRAVGDKVSTETMVEFDAGRFHYRIKDLNKSRVFTTHRDKGYAVISAFKPNPLKDGEILKTNLTNTERLEADLRRNNLGFRSALGGYRYLNTEGNQEVEEEISFFVPWNEATHSQEEFLDIILSLAEKYGQETALVKLPNLNDFKETYVSPSGEFQFDFNKMKPAKESDEYYTKLKGNRVAFTLDTAVPNILDTYYGYRIPAGFADRSKDYKVEEESIEDKEVW